MQQNTSPIATCYGPVPADVMARATQIRLLICDVDGVLSDGLIYMGNQGEELKAFNVRDGYGIRCLVTQGLKWQSLPVAARNWWPIGLPRWASGTCIRGSPISLSPLSTSWPICSWPPSGSLYRR